MWQIDQAALLVDRVSRRSGTHPGRNGLAEKEPDELTGGGHDFFADYNGKFANFLHPNGALNRVVVGHSKMREPNPARAPGHVGQPAH
jgi:hypothetical protein